MAAEAPQLRPLTIPEIIDAAFRVYRRNFSRLVAIAAVVYVPLAIIEAVLAAVLIGSISRAPTGGPPMPTHLLAGIGIGGALLGILAWIGYMLAYAAMAVAISREYLGGDISPGEAYNQVLPALGRVILASILVGIIVGIGFMLCIIPGIYLAIALGFAVPLVVLEELGVGAAISRSMELVRGYWFRVFATMFLLGLIVAVIQMAILWPVNMIVVAGLAKTAPAAGQALSQLVNTLASMVLFPLTMTGLVVLYYDLRVRKEGFDLQLMAQQIGTKLGIQPPPAAPTPPPPGAETPAEEAELPPPATEEQTDRPQDTGEQTSDDQPRF